MLRQIITLIIDTPCWLGSHAKTLIRSFVFCRFDFFKMSFLVLLPQIVGQKPKFFCLIRSEIKISTTDADFKTLNQSVHPPQIVQNLIYCAIFNFFQPMVRLLAVRSNKAIYLAVTIYMKYTLDSRMKKIDQKVSS